MNKFFFIGLSIAITAFLATNALLMFGDKSILAKDVYVSEYERAYTNTHTEKLAKEALIEPLGTTQIYVQDSEAIEQWLVAEGDVIEAGSELALLNEAESEEQRAIWESERDALLQERGEVQSTKSSLESARSSQKSRSESRDASDNSTVTNGEGDTVELNVDLSVGVDVEVPQDGSYAAGIAQAEQQLAAIDSKLAVVEAQLAQSVSNPALISPVEGVVSAIQRNSEPLSIEIYSNEKSFVTYVLEDEWQEVSEQDRVFVHAEGMGKALPGTVLKKSQVPAEETRWLEAYRSLDPKQQKNPLAFYAVHIMTDEPIEASMPYGSKANASIITNEAADAVALPESWIFNRSDMSGSVNVLSEKGYAANMPVTINFDLNGKAVLSEGVVPGAVVLTDGTLEDFTSPPAVFMPFPSEQPDFEFAKKTNWRHYVEYLLAR